MRKDEKTHSEFHCDQTNGSWFQIGGTNFGGTNFVGPVHEERGLNCRIFGKFNISPMGKDEKKSIASIIVIKRMEEIWAPAHGRGG